MRRMVVVLTVLGLVGCTANRGSNPSSHGSVIHNRLASNRLAANRLPASHLAGNQLSSAQLSSDRFTLAPTDLMETDEGREVLTYLISCALSVGITLVGTDSHGHQTEFFGELGIAPQWLDNPLDRAGKGWVSACLFARVNNYGVAVPISVRGSSPALTVSPQEEAGWTLQEGAFYGMYFTPDDQPINWIACRGRDSALTVPLQRECAQPDPLNPGKTLCGFNFAGDCGSYFRLPGATACSAFSANGYYVNCADHAIYNEAPETEDEDCSHVFHQVITVFVQP